MIRVRHFGNTANNAFYNALILDRFEGVSSELPISMFGLVHAISAPAWEGVDFDVPGADWVARPDWSRIPGAVELNSTYTDILPPAATGMSAYRPSFSPARTIAAAVNGIYGKLAGRRWAAPLFDLPYGVVLARRPVVQSRSGHLDIFYGSDSIPWTRPSAPYVCLEHGTVRAIADGPRESALFRKEYRAQVSRAAHLWVTNLDPRTLEVAEDVAPGRWSALPHPYLPDPRVPFAGSPAKRAQLLESASAERLVLLPSSQNWAKTHDKGSMTALRAFVELRRRGSSIGLVAVEWGHQLAESQAFLAREGVDRHVVWVPPMARFGLQRMMADVDVVWDQFGLEAFGGLACRAVEQGTPFVSRGLAPVGEQLIGGPVPWLQAASTDDIVRQTLAVLADMDARGRDAVINDHRGRYRFWLLEHHSTAMTASLQREAYAQILDGAAPVGPPDAWAQHIGNVERNGS